MDSKIKYFTYIRKSTTDKKRQIQSFDNQKSEVKNISKRNNISSIETFIEARSACKPHNRPKYTEMIKRIKRGEANGIICWSLDRLTRNHYEAGELGQLLNDGVIKCIITSEKPYRTEDDVYAFTIAIANAIQYSKNLKKTVPVGLNTKRKKGDFPHLAPQGYLNAGTDKGTKYIINDPDRYELIKKMWKLFLTNTYSLSQICRIANNDWGYRTRVTEKRGGRELDVPTLRDSIFSNIFYYGDFLDNGIVYKGNHQPMITKEEYNQVQKLLGRVDMVRPQVNDAPYSGLIKCTECGCSIIYDPQEYRSKSGELQVYHYYHCSDKKKNYSCSQKSSINEEKLEKKIISELNQFAIIPDVQNWAMEVIRYNYQSEIDTQLKIRQTQMIEENKIKTAIGNLYMDKLLENKSEEICNSVEEKLKEKLKRLKDAQLDNAEINWLSLTETPINFVDELIQVIKEGTVQHKRLVLKNIASEYRLHNKVLSFKLEPFFVEVNTKSMVA